MFELIKKKRKILDSKNIKSSDENLKLAYNFLCRKEGLKPLKVSFVDILPKNINGQLIVRFKRIIFFYFTKKEIVIKKDVYWLTFLIHEFCHQILIEDLNYVEHGRIFNKLNKYLIEKYFDKILNKILKVQEILKKK